MSRNGKARGYLILYVIIGAITGTFIGEVLGSHFKILRFLEHSYHIGMTKPFYLDLHVMGITFGINFNINIMSMIGVILAIIIYREY
ncbi:hypothetical protein CLTEP_15230 [Clostridium tepidiprofundi DSM 19306]|uniref:DUF4321 domain-containing protein n=1 Tax=Clostridium tepidiprofundi DSM 19306 TaxID=1121338 RepID=A0A151B3J0_9CLOT|nr:DUF4321 domain-containing protein [Clostridium tepidiprofundi]KYH34475.1 hypothetical protein CLTEP_15230 [Clostridium tepidiprofundi DSM 19306]